MNDIELRDYLQQAVFRVLSFMCFGERVNDEEMREMERIQRVMVGNFREFGVMNILPKVISRIVLRKTWQDYVRLRRDQMDVMTPLIVKARNKDKNNHNGNC